MEIGIRKRKCENNKEGLDGKRAKNVSAITRFGHGLGNIQLFHPCTGDHACQFPVTLFAIFEDLETLKSSSHICFWPGQNTVMPMV